MKKLFHNRVFLSWLFMAVGTIGYCFAVVFILDKGKFYAGGVTGIVQIIANDIFKTPILKSILLAAINIPLFVLGFKKVSRRFAYLSLASVVLQTIFLYLFQLWYDAGFDPFKDFVYTVVDSNGVSHIYGQATMAIIGGALTGVTLGIALKYGASTGGIDIISQAYSFKTGFPFVIISFTIDSVVILTGMIINWDISVGVYTIIRLVICNISLDAMYKTYKYHKVSVVTSKPDIVKAAMLNSGPHAVTIYDCYGGYSGDKRYNFETVCMSYEVEDYVQKIKKVDPDAFIHYSSVKGISGKFNRRAIS